MIQIFRTLSKHCKESIPLISIALEQHAFSIPARQRGIIPISFSSSLIITNPLITHSTIFPSNAANITNLRIFTPHTRHQHTTPQPDTSSTSASIIDGRAIAQDWQNEMALQVKEIHARGGRPPGLGVILVGDRPDSLVYVTRKKEACDKIGMHTVLKKLPGSTTQMALRRAVMALCSDPSIDGVLVQLPLPPHIDEEDIIEHFDPGKDVDGFHPLNVGRTLMRGHHAKFVPCTALGCMELLKRNHIPVRNKSIVIVGDSNIVGMPLAMLFRDEGAATVTVVHRTSYSSLFGSAPQREMHALMETDEQTAQHRADANACLPKTPGPHHQHHHIEQQPYEISYSSGLRDAYLPRPEIPTHLADLANITKTADILVVAVGYPELVKKDWIKPGAVVLDVGINVVDWGDDEEESKNINDNKSRSDTGDNTTDDEDDELPHFHVVGDVDFDEAMQVASAVTPVPGGVGPMTIAAVLHNTVQAAAVRCGIHSSDRSE